MKRTGRLYHRISGYENVRIAFWKAAKGKQNRREVIEFRANFEANIQKIREQIVKKETDIGHYHFFEVHDPKPRSICAASFPERVLHHAIMNIFEPCLESYAIYDSYACRKGKGTHKAVARARAYSKKFHWFLKLDIRKYFDSIDQKTMFLISRGGKSRFSRKFRKYEKKWMEGEWSEETLIRHMEPLIEFTRLADSTRFRRCVIKRFGVPSRGSSRVLRGGGWINDARNCRTANRDRNNPGKRNNAAGLRLVAPPAHRTRRMPVR